MFDQHNYSIGTRVVVKNLEFFLST